jgi:hypothetical protein
MLTAITQNDVWSNWTHCTDFHASYQDSVSRQSQLSCHIGEFGSVFKISVQKCYNVLWHRFHRDCSSVWNDMAVTFSKVSYSNRMSDMNYHGHGICLRVLVIICRWNIPVVRQSNMYIPKHLHAQQNFTNLQVTSFGFSIKSWSYLFIINPTCRHNFLWPLILNRSDGGLFEKPKLVTCRFVKILLCMKVFWNI